MTSVELLQYDCDCIILYYAPIRSFIRVPLPRQKISLCLRDASSRKSCPLTALGGHAPRTVGNTYSWLMVYRGTSDIAILHIHGCARFSVKLCYYCCCCCCRCRSVNRLRSPSRSSPPYPISSPP